jgi:hypothetical protein
MLAGHRISLIIGGNMKIRNLILPKTVSPTLDIVSIAGQASSVYKTGVNRRSRYLLYLFLFGLLVCTLVLPAVPANAKEVRASCKVARLAPNPPIYRLAGRSYGGVSPLCTAESDAAYTYTLHPGDAPKMASEYKSVDWDVIREDHKREMSWIAYNGDEVGKSLEPFDPKEFSARQIAIWSYGTGVPISPETVPDAQLRTRAQELRAAADAVKDFGSYATTVNLSVYVTKATYDKVFLEASLRDENGDPLADKTIRILWHNSVVIEKKTDHDGLVRATKPRPDHLVKLAADWPDTSYISGTYLLPTDVSQPALLMQEELDFYLRDERDIDPATLTSGPQLLYQTVSDALRAVFGTRGQQVAALVVLLLIAGPYAVGIFTVLSKARGWRKRTAPDSGTDRGDLAPREDGGEKVDVGPTSRNPR